jgi:hypothetical protein
MSSLRLVPQISFQDRCFRLMTVVPKSRANCSGHGDPSGIKSTTLGVLARAADDGVSAQDDHAAWFGVLERSYVDRLSDRGD